MRVHYTENAKKDLEYLSLGIAQRIIKKIYFYSLQESPLHYATKLVNSSVGSYRFRIGEYRVIFDINDKGDVVILIVLRIGHRKEVYRHV